MRTLSAVALLLCALFSTHRVLAQDPNALKRAEKILSLGQQLYDEGKYQTAADTLEKASILFEKLNNIAGQVKSLNLFGECKANLNQCDQSLEIINRSLTLALANLKADGAEVADTYYYLARANGGCSRKFDVAIPLMHKSIGMKRKLYGEGSEVAFNYTFMGYMFDNMGKSDSAFYYLTRSLTIREKNLAPDDIETSNTLYYLARNYENKSELSKALALYLRSFKIRKAKLDPLHANISNSTHQIGSVYQKLGNFDRALDYYQKALDIRIKSLGAGHANVASSYYTIGTMYGTMYNYHQSIHYIKQGNAILEKIYGDKSDILPTYIAYLGRMYGNTGDHAAALANLKSAQTMAEKNLGPDHPYLAIVYNIIGDYYADVNNSPKDTEYFSKAVLIFRKAYGVNSAREADVLSKIGSIHAKNKNFKEALAQYKLALDIYRAKMGDQNPKVAAMYQLMGDAERDQQQFQKALVNYQKAYTAVSTGFNDTSNVSSDPTLAQLDNKPLALRIAGSKADVLSQLAKTNKNDVNTLKNGLRTYQFAVGLIDDIASGYNLENARVELEKESRKIYHNGMNIAYQLYAKTKDKNFIHDAFVISEKSKSAMLLENIRDGRAKSLAGVPDSLIELERDIKIALAYYQSMLHQAQKSKDTAKVALQEKNIFETQQQHDQLKSRLEKQFLAYFNFKYNQSQPSLNRVQQSLPDEATAIAEFYVQDSVIYRFTISKSNLALKRIENDEAFRKVMSDYEKSLTDANFILNSRNEADQLYITSASALYDLLLKSTLENSKTPITKLIIIPDDMLAQFNFGTLLTKRISEKTFDYKNLEYLTKHCQISYAYSSALINDAPLKRKNPKYVFAGFAPSYTGNQFIDLDTVVHPIAHLVVRSGNLPLPGAAEEVRLISQFMGGDSWVNQEATESNFKTHAADYDVLHLAMHSLLNNENPHYSELLFNHENDLENDGYLNVAEIYNLKLNAAMVVLSACSSGFGKIQKGEGPISISRAFSYAGCPSVVMSLWKIPDAVTSQIMTNFYQELKNGKQKDEALRLAQLKFLTETSDPLYHHPYFWAGFVVMGDTAPLPEKFPFWIVYSVVILGLIVLIFLGIRRNRVRQLTQADQEVQEQPHV